MTKVALLFGLCGLLAPFSTPAAGQPRGAALEVHSCELYAGGCVVSSEATQGGRYMVRAWSFSDGEFSGVSLAGLSVAAMEISEDNLAAPDSHAARAVVYLPENATESQRAALLKWLSTTQKDLAKAEMHRRIVPISLAKTDGGYHLSAGEFLSIQTAGIESCPTGACGEALWYSPRSAGHLFTVAVNRAAVVNEPLLQLKWRDAGKKSVFLCRFGDRASDAQVFVSLADLCGSAGNLF